jgi:hypothetical protein
MIVNTEQTIITLIENKKVILDALDYMDNINSNQINITQFDIFVSNQMDLIKKQYSGKHVNNKLYNIELAFSIKNLRKHNLIQVDDSNGRIDFVDYIEDMFKALQDNSKVKPITNRIFIQHSNNLISIIEDSYKFESFSNLDKEVFFEDLRNFLKNVKQDFEKNINTIIGKSNSLSSYLDDKIDSSINKQKVMQQIVELCDKYIEPFFNFLSTSKNKDGFVNNLVKLKVFFKNQDMNIEEQEVSRFIMSFGSYHKDIKSVYEQINEYRRKGQKDLILFNSFESAFKELDEYIMAMQDGKMTKNYLDISNYHENYNNFDNIKTNNITRSEINCDYDNFVQNFDQIEKTSLIDINDEDKAELPNILNQEDLDIIALKDEYIRNVATMNNKTTSKISRILSRNSQELRKADDTYDIYHKLHVILSKNIENYKPFYVLYAYTHLRKSLTNVRVGHNIRKNIKHDNKKYNYRPVYSVGA